MCEPFCSWLSIHLTDRITISDGILCFGVGHNVAEGTSREQSPKSSARQCPASDTVDLDITSPM